MLLLNKLKEMDSNNESSLSIEGFQWSLDGDRQLQRLERKVSECYSLAQDSLQLLREMTEYKRTTTSPSDDDVEEEVLKIKRGEAKQLV